MNLETDIRIEATLLNIANNLGVSFMHYLTLM